MEWLGQLSKNIISYWWLIIACHRCCKTCSVWSSGITFRHQWRRTGTRFRRYWWAGKTSSMNCIYSAVIRANLSPFNAWVQKPETLDAYKGIATMQKRLFSPWKGINIKLIRYLFHPSHPMYAIAKKQMTRGGGLVTFDLKGVGKR